MPVIAIEKYRDHTSVPERLWRDINDITEEVRRRAFTLFEGQGRRIGSDLENWVAAEREVLWAPPSEVIETPQGYQARIALPGFQAKDLQVVATPGALIIEAEAQHTHEGKKEKVCLCEFSDKKLFRRLELPSQIDVDQTTAQLENGILQVNAPKAAATPAM